MFLLDRVRLEADKRREIGLRQLRSEKKIAHIREEKKTTRGLDGASVYSSLRKMNLLERRAVVIATRRERSVVGGTRGKEKYATREPTRQLHLGGGGSLADLKKSAKL